MRPILTVEFTAKAGDVTFPEESVPIHSPEELFAFVAPGGGCENIPDEVEEIQMVFSRPEHPNSRNPVAYAVGTLQLGMVYMTGPLAELVQTAEQLLDKAGRGELAESFLRVIGTG